MVPTLAVTDHIDSLAEAGTQFGLSYSNDPLFFGGVSDVLLDDAKSLL